MFCGGAMPISIRMRVTKVERTLALFTALAGLLLLLGCLNAGLFLVGKALAETRQAAMERALGAGTLRIGRRRFAEAALLCGGALVAGSACAAWWIQLLAAFPPPLAMIVFRPVVGLARLVAYRRLDRSRYFHRRAGAGVRRDPQQRQRRPGGVFGTIAAGAAAARRACRAAGDRRGGDSGRQPAS